MNSALSYAVPAFSARPLTSRRMNTCRSASKQATSSLFRIHTYAKVRGGLRVFQRGGPSPLPAIAPPTQDALSPHFFFTLFEITPIISTLSKKHPGYRGLYLQTPLRKRRVPKGDSHSETRQPILPCLFPTTRLPRRSLGEGGSLATSSHPRYPSLAAPLGAP